MKKIKFIADVKNIGLPFIMVNIDEHRSIVMLVDTGSDNNQLFENAYKEIEELFIPTGDLAIVHGIGTDEKTTEMVEGTLFIGGEKIETQFQISPEETGMALSEHVGFPVSGIIGSFLMLKYGWIIDYSNQQILIEK